VTQDEENLFAKIQHNVEGNPPASLKRTMEQFVLHHGWWYAPCALPLSVRPGTGQRCFGNAFDLAQADLSLMYCEGYAIGKSGILIHHAWVTDGKGSAIDNTFAEPGRAYAGVPFQLLFLLQRAVKNHAVITVLDDWEHDWPILGDLGDRPGEWIEPKGYGHTRIAQPGLSNKTESNT